MTLTIERELYYINGELQLIKVNLFLTITIKTNTNGFNGNDG